MIKIWLNGPDISKNCCGCQGKTSPCDSCYSCTGIYYNNSQEKFLTSNINFDPYFIYPASDCYVAKHQLDSYTIESGSPKNLTINLTDQDYEDKYRGGAFTIKINSGETGYLTLNTQAYTSTPYYAESVAGGLGYYIEGSNVYVYPKVPVSSPADDVYVTAITGDFYVQPNMPIKQALYTYGQQSGFLFKEANGSLPATGGANQVQTNITDSGGNPVFRASLGIGADLVWGAYYEVQQGDLNGFRTPGSFDLTISGEIGLEPVVTEVDIGERCWVCDYNLQGFFYNWFGSNSSINIYGNASSIITPALVSAITANNSPAGDGNYTYGVQFPFLTPEEYRTGPDYLGIPCNADNLGEERCYNGSVRIIRWVSTTWPKREGGGPDSGGDPTKSIQINQTNTLVFSAYSGTQCFDVFVFGNGTTSDSSKTTKKTISLTFSGKYASGGYTKNITPGTNLVPIVFYNEPSTVIPCPFILP